jgi:hypothetical protein
MAEKQGFFFSLASTCKKKYVNGAVTGQHRSACAAKQPQQPLLDSHWTLAATFFGLLVRRPSAQTGRLYS